MHASAWRLVLRQIASRLMRLPSSDLSNPIVDLLRPHRPNAVLSSKNHRLMMSNGPPQQTAVSMVSVWVHSRSTPGFTRPLFIPRQRLPLGRPMESSSPTPAKLAVTYSP